MTEDVLSIACAIARELNVNTAQVEATINLLDEGATVPFIARYRKEVTNGLDDTQLRMLSDRLYYLRELNDRRLAILQSIRDQDKMTDVLEKAILSADTKARLEDLYLPYRPKRRTKAHVAKEAGLEPLASALLTDTTIVPTEFATQFLNPAQGIETVEAALEGARQILMEKFAEDPDLLSELRQYVWQNGLLKSSGAKGKKVANNKFADYFDYSEAVRKIPSHRALALFRGRRDSALQLALVLPDTAYGEQRLLSYFNIKNEQALAYSWLIETVRLAWTTKLFIKLELEVLAKLREMADDDAIQVFATNLRDLLLAAPAGHVVTIGLDPGIRTGVKVVVVDKTGKVLDYSTIFPLAPHNDWHPSIATLAKLAAKYNVNLISIGNGTGSRETERLVTELIKMYPDLALKKVLVSEAGASVYSASELAAKEFPDLDVTLRGAVSIARRLQDPLPELVKIDPKSIGVGQYQHDVNQPRLARTLEAVIEDCVNAVGVDINLASAALLRRVSGLNETLANNLVEHRNQHGAFRNRDELKNVDRMGEKTFQQAAGFLRVMQGDNPLDASGVHPESYPIIENILADKAVNIRDLIGNTSLLKSLNASDYVTSQYGLPTVKDILQELEKPGRDPRPEFKTVSFKEGVEDINDLHEGMELEGVVSNVTNFGAFVDIGVHQDGLVHISAMTNHYISDPHKIVKSGDIIKVKVTEIDKERRRIGLTMKLHDEKPVIASKPVEKQRPVQATKSTKKDRPVTKKSPNKQESNKAQSVFNTAMADALSKLKKDHV